MVSLNRHELPFVPCDVFLRQVADQRPTKMPVTFALMTLLIREHNRCCDVLAPEWDADTDEVWQKRGLPVSCFHLGYVDAREATTAIVVLIPGGFSLVNFIM